jgi:hypothetical protein
LARAPSSVGVTKGSATADEATVAAIFKGVNLTQLSVIFKQDYRTVVRKLFEAQVKPVMRVGQVDYYSIYDAAPFLVKPAYDIETAIRKMSFKDLPKDLAKEFWAGQKSKQDYEEKAGQLWRTEKVVEEVGELMKIVKMSTLLMLDGVERQSELSERQREIIKSLSHGMLDDLVKRVAEKFKAPEVTHGDLQEVEDPDSL